MNIEDHDIPPPTDDDAPQDVQDGEGIQDIDEDNTSSDLIPLGAELPPLKPYGRDQLAYPDIPPVFGVQQVIDTIQRVSNASTPMIAQAVLTGIATAAQGVYDVRTTKSEMPISLWAVALADSGAGKSEGMKYAFQPMEKKSGELQAEYDEQMKSYEYRKAKAKQAKQLAEFERDNPKPPAFAPRVCSEDVTDSALISRLAKSGRKVLAIKTAEGKVLIENFTNRNGSKGAFMSKVNQMFSGEAVTSERTTDGGQQHRIVKPRLSICLAVQIAPGLDYLFSEAGADGFTARSLVSYQDEQTPEVELDYDEYDHTLRELQKIYDPVVKGLLDVANSHTSKGNKVIICDNEAKAAIRDYHEAMLKRAARYYGRDPLLQGVYSRQAEIAGRIAAVLAVFREHSQFDAEAGATPMIDIDCVDAAVQIAAWHLDEFLRIRDKSGADDIVTAAQEIVDRVGEWLKEIRNIDGVHTMPYSKFKEHNKKLVKNSVMEGRVLEYLKDNGYMVRRRNVGRKGMTIEFSPQLIVECAEAALDE